METPKKQPCRKNDYQKISFDLKLSIIDEINNGQISANYASKKYGISRTTLAYWIKKLSNFESKSKAMSKNDELKKLRQRIEELEFVKDFQQDIIADFENITGEHLSKKYLPEALAKEIEKKRLNLSKQSGSINASE
ncbi:MAG: helix-turn-helix domain-containing protein [Flavobacterium sp.]|uniref:helix-turn-helix domain-containing protein n=1 Tax=Flavobacterium sp. TaxID=239 RepID=UPI0022C80484|nr:helix-turn-helix domain-containing protein [Flavobacterium sp.]MCZ8198704.1 helix-turn-helix domain-containing protein [Flavobacterium sp.]